MINYVIIDRKQIVRSRGHTYKRRLRKPNVEWLTPKEVAEKLGYHPNAAYYWIRTGQLRAKRTRTGYYRIAVEDLERFIDEYFTR